MAAPGRYIVMLGYAGAKTALTLASLHKEEVQNRFPKHFLKQEEELNRVVSRLTALMGETGKQSDRPPEAQECVVVLKENEVFPALWELAEGLDAGLDAELQKIPVLQFIIEISELFDANPYVNITALENKKCFGQMSACGACVAPAVTTYSLLIATENPEAVLAFAKTNELPAAVIGRLTGKNDRIVRNGGIIRYLTPEG